MGGEYYDFLEELPKKELINLIVMLYESNKELIEQSMILVNNNIKLLNELRGEEIWTMMTILTYL